MRRWCASPIRASSSGAASASTRWWWRCRRRWARPWRRAFCRSEHGRGCSPSISRRHRTLALGWRALPHTPRGRSLVRLAGRDASARSPSASASPRSTASAMARAPFSVCRNSRSRPPPACCWWSADAHGVAVVAGGPAAHSRFSLCRSATSIASFCAQMMAFVALPFYLQDRFGYSAVQIGLLITPWPIAVGLRGADRRTVGRTVSSGAFGRGRA